MSIQERATRLLEEHERLFREYQNHMHNGNVEEASRVREQMHALVPLIGEMEHELQRVIDAAQHEAEERLNTARERERRMEVLRHDLARRGWYIGGSIRAVVLYELADKVAAGINEGIEEALMEFARSRMESVVQAANALWASHAESIMHAVEAHRQRIYHLSIPALILQAEAIAREILGASIFSTVRNHQYRPATRAKAEDLRERHQFKVTDENLYQATTLDRLLLWKRLERLLGALELLHGLAYNTRSEVLNWRSERAVDETVSPLNRHDVTHAATDDKFTEAGSLRLIALLDYLSELDEALRDITMPDASS